MHVQESKFAGKSDKFGEQSFKKLNYAEVMEFFFFFKSAAPSPDQQHPSHPGDTNLHLGTDRCTVLMHCTDTLRCYTVLLHYTAALYCFIVLLLCAALQRCRTSLLHCTGCNAILLYCTALLHCSDTLHCCSVLHTLQPSKVKQLASSAF